jgi:tRNA threonylcarbamoyl adenosine modification protein (Sua5/YciO/YrdC/YwlC family)
VVDRAVAAIRAGEPVILPTDTVYGLCSAPEHAATLAALKRRPEMPIALLCADVETLVELVPEIPAGAVRTGPYTLVFPNPARRFPELGGGETIGVRVPDLPEAARTVVAQVGAVAATSANFHGDLDPTRLDDIPPEIRRACAVELDGGVLPGVPSTVIDVTGPKPRVVRRGAG